jgi:chromosome condensin MukBEF MukE localization factor
MTPEAMERLAYQRAVSVSIELETQLDKGPMFTPIKAVLGKAKQQAMTAMIGLVMTDAAEIDKVRAFQNEVRRYDDLVTWLAEIIEEGRAAEVYFREQDADEFAEILTTDEGRQEAEAFGIHPQDHDA